MDKQDGWKSPGGVSAIVGVLGFFLAVAGAFGLVRAGGETEAAPPPSPSQSSVNTMYTESTEDEAPVGWGPERPLFRMDNNAPNLTLNSTTDNPNLGDERNFVGARLDSIPGLWHDRIEAQDGELYRVRLYVHLEGPETHTAEGVTAIVTLPDCVGRQVGVAGFLQADNTFPRTIWDGTIFWSREPFRLRFVPDSALLENNYAPEGGFPLLGETGLLTGNGVELGTEKLDGLMAPGYENAGYVTFLVEPVFS